jgi:hypothetical protein
MHMHTIENCLVSITLAVSVYEKKTDQTVRRVKEQTILKLNWHKVINTLTGRNRSLS